MDFFQIVSSGEKNKCGRAGGGFIGPGLLYGFIAVAVGTYYLGQRMGGALAIKREMGVSDT